MFWDLVCSMAALIGGSSLLKMVCCLIICGGMPDTPRLVIQGSWTRHIEKVLDSDSLARFAVASLECWRLICRIGVG